MFGRFLTVSGFGSEDNNDCESSATKKMLVSRIAIDCVFMIGTETGVVTDTIVELKQTTLLTANFSQRLARVFSNPVRRIFLKLG